MQQNDLVVNGYRIIRLLGSGATGDVYLACKNDQNFALKIFKRRNDPGIASLVSNEFLMGQGANSPYISKPIEIFTENGFAHIVYQFAENGDFFDYIKVAGALPYPIFKAYATQIMEAVRALHASGICHMDIKLDNIVLDADFNI